MTNDESKKIAPGCTVLYRGKVGPAVPAEYRGKTMGMDGWEATIIVLEDGKSPWQATVPLAEISLGYSRPLAEPTTKQEGLANAVQTIINQIEAGNSGEALLQAVNLLDDVTCKSNPYLIGKEKARKQKPVYHGTVNTD